MVIIRGKERKGKILSADFRDGRRYIWKNRISCGMMDRVRDTMRSEMAGRHIKR